jgi:hypothetical protein
MSEQTTPAGPARAAGAPMTGERAAAVLGPLGVRDAQDAGRAAAWDGQPVAACPYPPTEDLLAQAQRLMWARGYAAGRTDLRTARDRQ